MNILALSYLFPNAENQSYGVFVLNRLKAVHKTCGLRVIAPLQWFPFIDRFQRAVGGSGIPEVEEIAGIKVFHPRFLTIPKFFKWFDSFSYFFSVLPIVYQLRNKDGFEFDIVDVHWTYPDILAGFAISRIYKKKFIVTIRGKEALYLGEWGGRKLLLNWFLKKADYVVTLSSELKNLVEEIGVSPAKSRVILNGVDVEQFKYVNKESAREKLGIKRDKKILLSVGSLIRRKGHHELIRVMSELSPDLDIELYIVGGVNPEGDYSAFLHQMVSDAGLKNVHFLDRIDHAGLRDWYAAADLFCLATAGEGCPNVVLEALACGTPVVTTNVGALPDLLRVGIDGFIVEQQHFHALAKTINDALNMTWDRKAISERLMGMSWNGCADQVLDVYKSVIGRPQ